MAEGGGFEPPVGFPTLAFEASALDQTQPTFHYLVYHNSPSQACMLPCYSFKNF